MLATLVSPGILPPTIIITPNSPMQCAKVMATAVMILGIILGMSTRIKVVNSDLPSVYDASRKLLGIAVKPFCKG